MTGEFFQWRNKDIDLIGVQETVVEGEAKQSTDEFSQKGKKKRALVGRLLWNEAKAGNNHRIFIYC